MLSSIILRFSPSKASLRGLDQEGARGHLRDHIHEMANHGIGQNGSCSSMKDVLVDHVQVYWFLQVVPQRAFVPAGSNEEIDVVLMPRDERVVTQEEGVWPEAGLIRSSSDRRQPNQS